MNLEFLIEMGWKSALIAGVALSLAALMRRRAAADRAAVLQLAVALLLATPVIALALPALEVETPPPAVQTAPRTSLQIADPMVQAPEGFASVPLHGLAAEDGPSLPDLGQLLLVIYAAGVALVLARLFAGLATLRGWARKASPVLSSEWLDALDRSALPRRPLPRLLVSPSAPAPMSWGFFRPVILLDSNSAARPEDADAIVTHEMAHIARRDWLSLLMARASVALFWFNPLVWLLERDMFQQVEEAADASALGHVEPTRYAQTLVSCAHRHSGARVPANSMAASGLKRRVTAVLEARLIPAGSRWTLAAMLGCAAFAAPVAAVKLVEAKAASEAPLPPAAVATMPGLAASAAPSSAPDAPLAVAALTPATAAITAAVAPQAPTIAQPAHPAPATRAVEAAIPHPATLPHPPFPHVVPPPAHHVPVMTPAEVEELKRDITVSIRSVAGLRIDAHAIAEVAGAGAAAAVHSVTAGRVGMESGARSMELSARKMEQAAHELNSKSGRERVIARERARGRTVTHEELIETGAGLAEGARDLRDGAREMREAAREMGGQG